MSTQSIVTIDPSQFPLSIKIEYWVGSYMPEPMQQHAGLLMLIALAVIAAEAVVMSKRIKRYINKLSRSPE